MRTGRAWPSESRERLIELAASGMIAGDIAELIGKTQASVLTYCSRHGIAVVKYSAEQQAIYDANARACEVRRQERKREANRLKKIAKREALKSQAAVAVVKSPKVVAPKVSAITASSPQVSKTSVGYRRQLAPAREMSKSELRAMLAQAVRNTAEASA